LDDLDELVRPPKKRLKAREAKINSRTCVRGKCYKIQVPHRDRSQLKGKRNETSVRKARGLHRIEKRSEMGAYQHSW
jgi:hypothetical protein